MLQPLINDEPDSELEQTTLYKQEISIVVPSLFPGSTFTAASAKISASLDVEYDRTSSGISSSNSYIACDFRQ